MPAGLFHVKHASDEDALLSAPAVSFSLLHDRPF